MSLLIKPLQRAQQPLGGAAAEIGGRYSFPAGAKPFSPRGVEKAPELFCEWAMLGMNPGLRFSCLPSGVFSLSRLLICVLRLKSKSEPC